MELLRIELQASPAANRHLVELGAIWCRAESWHFARLGAVAAADRLVVALDLRINVLSNDLCELSSLCVTGDICCRHNGRLRRWDLQQAFKLNDESLRRNLGGDESALLCLMNSGNRLVHERWEGLESTYQLGELLWRLGILEGRELREHRLHTVHVVH